MVNDIFDTIDLESFKCLLSRPRSNHLNAFYPDLGTDKHSEYYSERKFNSRNFARNPSGLPLININARLMVHKGSNFDVYLSSLNINFDAICIAKSWLHESDKNIIKSPTFQSFYSLRQTGKW